MYPNVHCSTLTIARTWKQARCPSTDEWIKLWYIYTVEYYSTIKRNAFGLVLMRRMTSSLLHKVKSERQIIIYLRIHMESIKMVLMNLSKGQEWRSRQRKQTPGHSGGKRRWDYLKE